MRQTGNDGPSCAVALHSQMKTKDIYSMPQCGDPWWIEAAHLMEWQDWKLEYTENREKDNAEEVPFHT